MQTKITHQGKTFSVNLHQPIDISIPLRAGEENVNAYYIPPVKMEPFRMGSFVGSVKEGGSCNVNNIFFNPHGNGTHTECVGHISKENFTINQSLKKFFFIAKLITIKPEEKGGDKVITKEQIELGVGSSEFGDRRLPIALVEALIIRTIPNDVIKLTKKYSGTNPPYITNDAAQWLFENDIEHLLLDLPSVDREDDGGKLLAHHAFWQYPHNSRMNCTITELIYVPDSVPDGNYLLNIQVASFESDASPSKPVLFVID